VLLSAAKAYFARMYATEDTEFDLMTSLNTASADVLISKPIACFASMSAIENTKSTGQRLLKPRPLTCSYQRQQATRFVVRH
jgi:hypothetical protein